MRRLWNFLLICSTIGLLFHIMKINGIETRDLGHITSRAKCITSLPLRLAVAKPFPAYAQVWLMQGVENSTFHAVLFRTKKRRFLPT